MKLHMAAPAERHTVVDVESTIRCVRPGLYVMRRKTFLVLLTLPSAELAAVPVAL
jgi:hypothetical protein